jgi:hypothetical protein
LVYDGKVLIECVSVAKYGNYAGAWYWGTMDRSDEEMDV